MLWKLKSLEMSENKITEEIKNMRLAFIKEKESNSVKKVIENMTPEQIKLYSELESDKYLPD